MPKKKSAPKKKAATSRACAIDNCKAAHHAKGYCKIHYGQYVRAQRKKTKPNAKEEVIAVQKGKDGKKKAVLSKPTTINTADGDPQKRLELIRQRHALLLAESVRAERKIEAESIE